MRHLRPVRARGNPSRRLRAAAPVIALALALTLVLAVAHVWTSTGSTAAWARAARATGAPVGVPSAGSTPSPAASASPSQLARTSAVQTVAPAPVPSPRSSVVPQPSTVVLDPPAARPVEVGSAVTLSAHVTPVKAGGTVRFLDGTAPVGPAVRVVNGVARWATSSLAPGPHAVSASFTPDSPTFAPASSLPESVVVRPPTAVAVPTVTLGVAPSSRVIAGTDLVLTTTVGPVGAVGTVEFYDGDSQIGDAVPVVGGVARLHTAALTIGAHRIDARFVPADDRWVSVTSAWSSVTVTKPAGTSIGLTVAPQGTVRRGTPLTLSVSTFPSSVTGSVTFYDGTTALGDPVAVVDGQVDLDVRTLALGTHRLTAEFAPDGTARPSTSDAVTVSVVTTSSTPQASRTTLVTAPGASVRLGVPVPVTAMVTTTSPGRIDLLDAGVAVGGGSVVAGRWTGSVTLPVGRHQLVARFVSYDPVTVAGSTSASAVITVVRGPVTVTSASLVAGQLGAALPGQPLTVTATVTPRDALGSVTISDRGRPVALVTVAGGLATWTATAAAGSHDYTATFTPSDPRFWTPATSRPASVLVPAVAVQTATPPAAPSGQAAPPADPTAQSPALAPVALESSIPTAATTNVALVKSGSDLADLVTFAVLLLLLGLGLMLGSRRLGSSRRAVAVAPTVVRSGAHRRR